MGTFPPFSQGWHPSHEVLAQLSNHIRAQSASRAASLSEYSLMPGVRPVRESDWRRYWHVLLVAGPLAVLLVAYLWMTMAHATPFLWNVVVHESGRYTLGETLFFVRHHLREVLVDVIMSLSIAAAVVPTSRPSARQARLAPRAAILAILLVLFAFAWSVGQEGLRDATRDLLQFRTRDDDASYGAHWRFHLLSTIWFAVAAQCLAAISAGSFRLGLPDARARRLTFVTFGLIAALTVIFGINAEPFTSGRYIGHQAREILTHGLVTLPLVYGTIRMCQGPPGDVPAGRTLPVGVSVAFWMVVAGIPIFLTLAFRGADLESTAQLSSGLSGVVAAHFFEHVLDYILVFLVAAALVMGRTKDPQARSPETVGPVT